MSITRKALGTIIRETLTAKGIPIVIKSDGTGAMRYEIDGELLSPGQVADRFFIVWGDGQPTPAPNLHGDGLAALHAAAGQHGFVTKGQAAIIAADPATRLHQLLVRCGGCRFIAPAQDVAHLIDIITREGSDYVRDVSIPVGDRP